MASPRAPILPHVELQGLVPGRLTVGAELDGVSVTGDVSGLLAPDVRALECELVDVVADDARLRGGSWADARWVRVRATSLDAARTVLRDVVWDGCRIGALTLAGGTVTRVHVRGCKLDYVNLRQASVTDLTVEDCTIGELDLGEARLTRVRLVGCRVESLRLSGSRSEHVDVSGAGSTFRVEGLDGLRGVTCSYEQALHLAPALVADLGGHVAT